MKIEVHVIVCNIDWVTPWTLRHYCSFADRVVLHDTGPDWSENGTTRELCRCHGAEWQPFDTAGQLNDELFQILQNTCWNGTDADWVIMAGADELIWFPPSFASSAQQHRERALAMLENLDRMGAAVIKAQGFEMFADEYPEPGAHHQVWEAIKDGAPDERWYSKPILFSPRRVADPGFGIGSHASRPVLRDGRAFIADENYPKAHPAVYLLHYHQIGPASAVAARYDRMRENMSAVNIKNGWGNLKPGAEHVAEKRAKILPNLRRVVI